MNASRQESDIEILGVVHNEQGVDIECNFSDIAINYKGPRGGGQIVELANTY
jgi:hypothetical protein